MTLLTSSRQGLSAQDSIINGVAAGMIFIFLPECSDLLFFKDYCLQLCHSEKGDLFIALNVGFTIVDIETMFPVFIVFYTEPGQVLLIDSCFKNFKLLGYIPI